MGDLVLDLARAVPTDALVVAPVLLPLLVAAAQVALGRARTAQRVLSTAALAVVLVDVCLLLALVDADGVQVVQLGGWVAPLGISLVVDRLAALLLVTAIAVLLAVLVFAVGQGIADDAPLPVTAFHPAYLVLAAGISHSFVTGDLFNLFVAFEVMLVASYVLLTISGTAPQVRSGMTYVVTSLLSSMLFLTGVALIYAATGTVGFADLSVKLDDVPDGTRTGLGLVLLVAFGIKAAVFPLFAWLPDSYPTAPAPVTAVFAGLLTKVGVYAILRTQALLFPSDEPSTVLLVLGTLTMVVGILGAIAQQDLKRMLSFTLVSHIGYMIFGLGLWTQAGVAGAVVYVVHHIVVQTTLFLVAALVERRVGTCGLDRMTGVARAAPLLGVLFFLPALSLAGIPPFSGFVAKLGLIQAGVEVGGFWPLVAVAASLAVSLLTLYAVGGAFVRSFMGDVQLGEDEVDEPTPRGMLVPTLVAVAAVVALAPAAGALYGVGDRAATDLLDRTTYVTAVEDAGPLR